MPEHDGGETKPTAVIVGPMALAGVVLAVRAIHRRSYASAIGAIGLFGVEAGFGPYRRLLRRGALRRSDAEAATRESSPGTRQPGA